MIARLGSFSAAARALGVTQPTLSTSLRRMETKLDTLLVQRGRDGVRLTSTGQELLSYSNEILIVVERAHQAIRGLEAGDVGRFTIACPDALGAFLLPQFLTRLFREAPRLELAIWNGTSREVERAVLAREAHFGLVAGIHPHPEFVRTDLFDDATEVVALAPWPRDIVAARARLRAGPLLYRQPQDVALLRRLAEENLLPERLVPCGTLELIKAMAIAGVGVAILPRRVASYGVKTRLRTLHPALPSITDKISLLHRADLHRTRAALRVKTELVACGKKLATA